MQKLLRRVITGLACMVGWCLHAVAQAPRAPEVNYVASTPCSLGTRPVPGIAPGQTGCELIKWRLRLSGGGQQLPGSYVLDCDYGIGKQGSKGFVNGGMHLHREGKWALTKGMPANPAAIIYRLDPDKPAESIAFVQLNGSLLHLLDSRGQLMNGTGAWSYTLSKVQP